jgi:phospho-N-acetylmuramoyl-pentapeptide-transferase
MLYHLLFPLRDEVHVFNVFRYITFRTGGAALTALVLSILLGPSMIRFLRSLAVGQSIRSEGPTSHHTKAGTPTMGGLLILLALLLPTLLWANLTNRYVWFALATTLGYGAVGSVLPTTSSSCGASAAWASPSAPSSCSRQPSASPPASCCSAFPISFPTS